MRSGQGENLRHVLPLGVREHVRDPLRQQEAQVRRQPERVAHELAAPRQHVAQQAERLVRVARVPGAGQHEVELAVKVHLVQALHVDPPARVPGLERGVPEAHEARAVPAVLGRAAGQRVPVDRQDKEAQARADAQHGRPGRHARHAQQAVSPVVACQALREQAVHPGGSAQGCQRAARVQQQRRERLPGQQRQPRLALVQPAVPQGELVSGRAARDPGSHGDGWQSHWRE